MGSGLVDLRSDTVTRPTAAMRRAMADAELGDDCYGEDPTVNRLQELFAERLGKQAALFVPSGTMGNQIAVRTQAAPGTSVVAGRRQHLVLYENGATARNSSVQIHAVDDEDGILQPADVDLALEAASYHQPAPVLVCLENTHMAAGGVPWSIGALDSVARAAGRLPIHMDGARLFNAEVATGKPAATLASLATTVMCCLSKGLCAPVGSLLAGPSDLIREARTERARLGGGMRQSGVLAAAGIVALTSMVERLAEDHSAARRLASAVADRWPESGCDPDRVRTNIVVFPHPAVASLLAHLRSENVLVSAIAPGRVRLVTHHDVDMTDVDRACLAISRAP